MKKGDAYNKEGREVVATIEREKYIIEIVKQELNEKSLDNIYRTIAKLLYKESTM